ncbi:EpsG family protein [Neobacillus terrae]|uniref:EpsG family protein n=1 Tax=Neobacillus terrae TaxID=3034837 RepID=UPI00140CC541|nr:EpsG family protein [Neobacillus terrae]NHM30010.1 EpsG family protein [Neobacillus terrae]
MYFALILTLSVIIPFTKIINYFRLKIFPIILVSLFLMFNRGNNDYLGYLSIFFYPEGYAEPGYVFLVNMIKFFGGTSHNQVLWVLGILFIITLYRFAKHSKTINFVLLLYVIFPFVLDITQIRNTFMMLFVLNAFIEYFRGKKIRTLIWLLISSTFHFFGIFYIISFLLIGLKKEKSYYKLIILISLIGLFFMPALIRFGISYIPIPRIVDRLTVYTADTIKYSSLFIWGGILILDLIVFRLFIKRMDLTENNNKNQIQLIYDFMFTGLVFLGCVLFLFEFNRFFRNLFLLKYLLADYMLPSMTKNAKLLLVVYLLITAVLFAFLYSLGIEGMDYNTVLLRNSIFGY